MQLFSGNTAYTYDTTRVFYGDTTNVNSKTDNGFISIIVNGSVYYVQKYSGDNTTDCCSNIISTETHEGTFTSYGFALIWANGVELKWIELFTKA